MYNQQVTTSNHNKLAPQKKKHTHSHTIHALNLRNIYKYSITDTHVRTHTKQGIARTAKPQSFIMLFT